MGKHDDYGKILFQELFGDKRWSASSPERIIDESGVQAYLDGIIYSKDGSVEYAVEIEARVYKQIRGAIVDLALHKAPKKLLVIMRAQSQLGTEEKIIEHCSFVWRELAGQDRGVFQVICLSGTGNAPAFEEDKRLLMEKLQVIVS
nr:hypothetical protein DMOBY_13650 [Dehalococcoides mccartyi]